MKKNSERYLSLDVLRGLTVTMMIIVNMPGNEATTYAPLLHAAWHGFTLTDLVFPTFLFAVGNALSFSLGKYEAMGNAAVLKKIFSRTLLIFMIGFLLSWFPFVTEGADGRMIFSPLSDTRILGVLQRIALAYCFASLIVHYLKLRGAILYCLFALPVYWFLMFHFGDYTLTGNAALKLDKLVLGESHMYHGEGMAFDPEGILSTLPAIVNVLAGYFTGVFLKRKTPDYSLIARLVFASALCIGMALSWNQVFPINKKLWTSSYVFLTVGLDLLILSILILMIEIWQYRRWAYFFEVFGKNTLFIYVFAELFGTLLALFHVGSNDFYHWLFLSVFQPLAGDYNGSLLCPISLMLICWSVGYYLDKRKIYIKV